MNILVSACLLGVRCRYNGTGCPSPLVAELSKAHRLIPVCPEELGGLPTPRPAAERQNDQVMTAGGQNVTTAFQIGAEKTKQLAEQHGCTHAILKSRSPSCGYGMIYDGSFQGKLIPGNGITAELLHRHGIRILNETQPYEQLLSLKK